MFGNTKKTGTDTEYCEQVVPALHFGDDDIIDGFSMEAVGGIALKSVMDDVATRKLLKAIKSSSKSGISDLVDNEANFNAQYQAKDSRKIRFGPAGSGTKNVIYRCTKLRWFSPWCQKSLCDESSSRKKIQAGRGVWYSV